MSDELFGMTDLFDEIAKAQKGLLDMTGSVNAIATGVLIEEARAAWSDLSEKQKTSLISWLRFMGGIIALEEKKGSNLEQTARKSNKLWDEYLKSI